MDEVNVVIQSVLPVQQSLPPQKKKARSTIENEDSSFERTMRIENKSDRKRRKRNEKKHQKKRKEYNLSKPSVTKEEPIVKKEEKKTEQLLLAVSEQMVAIEQLHAAGIVISIHTKIQELYKEYGNIKLNELPALNYNNYKNFFQI